MSFGWVLAYYAPSYKCLSANDLARLHQSKVPIPENEAERIFALRQTELLDSDRDDPMFDRFTALAQRLFNVPIALVSLVDIKRQWYVMYIHCLPAIVTHHLNLHPYSRTHARTVLFSIL